MSTIKKLMMTAAGGAEALAIEDVFSTYLYTGNGSTQTITNGIDLAGEGGLVWAKKRNSATDSNHILFDTDRGAGYWLSTNNTSAQLGSSSSTYINYNSDGFGWTFGSSSWNYSGDTLASWTFRKAPRFFDVVTYTGDGVAGRTISHNLGVTPGCIIVKCTSNGAVSYAWNVYHRSLPDPQGSWLLLNSSNAYANDSGSRWNDTLPTDTEFSVKSDNATNASGQSYVAYLFAHDPLGPSGDGSDGLIACGSFTTDGSGNATVNLGWEPQFLILKATNWTSSWLIHDNMRGFSHGRYAEFYTNSSIAEIAGTPAYIAPTATGFSTVGSTNILGSSNPYIYIAIRRGPMRQPTSGTEVFSTYTRVGTGTTTEITTPNFVTDTVVSMRTGGTSRGPAFFDRLRGVPFLQSSATSIQVDRSGMLSYDSMSGFFVDGEVSNSSANSLINSSGQTYVNYVFRRAPGFFDVVAYTGNGVAGRTVPHNLGVAPEMMIVKARNNARNWGVMPIDATKYMYLNQNIGALSTNSQLLWFNTQPSDSIFTLGTDLTVNGSGWTYIAYLFATLPGVSKVGSYTGNGTSQTIDCGFTSGARFVLIKRTDNTGDWYVWDTARGIVAGNDPHLSLNTTAAEVTTDDSVDPDSSGFIVNQVAATNINVSSASYIYLAIS